MKLQAQWPHRVQGHHARAVAAVCPCRSLRGRILLRRYGFIAFVATSLMFCTAYEAVRRQNWEVFWWCHQPLYLTVIAMSVVHLHEPHRNSALMMLAFPLGLLAVDMTMRIGMMGVCPAKAFLKPLEAPGHAATRINVKKAGSACATARAAS